MSLQSLRILDESQFTVKFGINDGLSVVRAFSYDKFMALSLEDMRLIFQPANALKIRQFGLEAILSGSLGPLRLNSINDIIDLTELATSISSHQFRDPFIKRDFVKEIKKKCICRVKEMEIVRDIVIEMFLNSELDVSLIHPVQFGTLFNTTGNDTLTYMVGRVSKLFHLVSKIYMVRMGHNEDTKEAHFVTIIFPSIVRAINNFSTYGRRIRGAREITKHRKDILSNKFYEYTVEESTVLIKLLDQVIEENAKYELTTT